MQDYGLTGFKESVLQIVDKTKLKLVQPQAYCDFVAQEQLAAAHNMLSDFPKQEQNIYLQ